MANSMNKAWEEAREGKTAALERMPRSEFEKLRVDLQGRQEALEWAEDFNERREAEAKQAEDRATKELLRRP